MSAGYRRVGVVGAIVALIMAMPVVGAAQSTGTRWAVAPEGNEARYLVREQLAGLEFPNDAIGRTSAVTGAIVFAADGSVDAAESRLEIDLTTLKSDEDRRDNYLRRNTLNVAENPTAVFVPTAVRGLPSPVPASGQATFELIGNLTVRGNTHPITWSATATFHDGMITGVAKTQFTFEEMGLTKPSLARLLSVADDIRLEYDFRLVRQ